ncbi:MAG TPA: superinfection immunity protein, partial [Castellaniella sp.]|nr:superinfection immunity protein [Castellaniella sp.]
MTILRLLLLLLWVGYALSMAQVPASELKGFGKMVSFSLFAAAPLLYFLPTIEAALRFHPNQTSITLVNLLLGWTLLGWVVAIAWACKSQTVPNGRWDPDYGAYCSQRQVGAGISRQAAA